MASTTENSSPAQRDLSEQEPLLGRPGDASQQQGKPLYFNLVLGTAVIAQAGVWILVGIVWGSVLSKDVMLFSAHPLLNSAGLLFLTEAILILQPTHTAAQKKTGTYIHSALNGIGLAALYAGLAIIVYNKAAHNGTHFESPHAILGLMTYIIFFVQALIGATTFYTPKLFGSVDRAKGLYKWHRLSGYLVVVLGLVTVAAATWTPFNENTLKIQLWAVIVASVILLTGLLPRIKKHKLGL